MKLSKRGIYKGSVGAGFKSFGEGVEAAKRAAIEVLSNPLSSGTPLELKALAVLRQAGRRQLRANVIS